MQNHPQHTALGSKVHRQIQHGPLNRSVRHPLHAAGVLLQHQEVIRAKERHGGRHREAAHYRSHLQVRLKQRGNRRLRLLTGAGVGEENHGQRGEQHAGRDQSSSAPGSEASAPASWGGNSVSHGLDLLIRDASHPGPARIRGTPLRWWFLWRESRKPVWDQS